MPVLRAARGLPCLRYARLFVDRSFPAIAAPRHGGFSPVSAGRRRLFFMADINGGRGGGAGGGGHPRLPQHCISGGISHSHRHSIGMSYSGGSPHKREGDEEVAAAAPPSSSSPSESSLNSASPGSRLKEAFTRAEKSEDLHVSNYWGITPKEIKREDDSQWPWHCFKPSDTYVADTKIDLKRHHIPDSFIDKIALWTVKALRVPTDLFFQKRYGCRAMMLETVAAVPGMVGGMLLHSRSLRKFEHSGGWIKALLDEAENERMHLMTFMEVAKPKWYERALVVMVQGIFFNAYFLLYVMSPRLAHRITGYLEEEAIYSYTEYLKEIDNGHLPNVPAPAIAIDYWRLPKDSNIRDVVLVVRADEAHHRDVNHFAADIHEEGKKLNEAPAPVGYH